MQTHVIAGTKSYCTFEMIAASDSLKLHFC